MLTMHEVVAGYGAMTILHGVTLEIRAGRITTVIGPNGAGKSTVFKTIFGILPLRGGDIRFDGSSIAGSAPGQLLARGITYVPQGRNLFPELTVRHNLELGGFTIKDRRALEQRMDLVMEQFAPLRAKADVQASVLSGGEQKMLEVGRALLLDPKLLLIDEPSIGLAPKLVTMVFDTLLGLRDRGITVVMVEQNAKSALAISDDALVLEQGRLALSGPAARMLGDPKVHSLFLGGGLQDGSPTAL
ncbi:MAG: ABC transporter ATP-binding protein [Alphaproteobacteria bacterium]